MKTIIVASQNPVKVNATLASFQQMFPDESFEAVGVSVPSGVSDQPMTSTETIQGAMTRATNAREANPDADYWVGIEGGIDDTDDGMQCFAWVIVLGQGDRIGRGQTAVFYVPIEVADLVRDGIELGHADDQVFGRSNSKQQNGAIGLLTDDAVDRTSYYVQAVIMALVPFKNPTLTW
jgi:inosine/xanthosine triphosphatase